MEPYCTYCLCYSLTFGRACIHVCKRVCVRVYGSGHCNSLTAGSLSEFIHTHMKSPSDPTTSIHLKYYFNSFRPFWGFLVCMFSSTRACVSVAPGSFSFLHSQWGNMCLHTCLKTKSGTVYSIKGVSTEVFRRGVLDSIYWAWWRQSDGVGVLWS